MKTFYTVTDQDTTYTNSRSQRFDTWEDAAREAQVRIDRGIPAVYILKAITLVRPKPKLNPVDYINLL